MTTEEIFERVMRLVEARWGGEPPPVRLKWDCHYATKDNVEDPRVVAHTLHLVNTICVHPVFRGLKVAYQCGILLHEMGHIFAGPEDSEADLWVDEQLGIAIKYKNLLQWVPVNRLGV